MDNKVPLEIRQATPEDANFILNSWLKSYRQSNFAKAITNTVYFEGHHKVIRALLKKSSCLIACNEQDPNQIYGYIVSETVSNIPVVHYAYVKQTFRSMRIGQILLNKVKKPEEAGVYTHSTRAAEKLAAKYNLIHHPYLAFAEAKED